MNFGARFPNVWPLRYFDAILGKVELLASRTPSVDVRIPQPRLNRRMIRILLDLLALPPPSRPRLFTNASGDFTLMSKSDWVRLRGYPEMQMFSMHLDSLLLYIAHYAGIKELCLEYPIYHINHSKGWSPLNAGEFYDEISRKGIPILSYQEFLELTDRMVKRKRAVLFNDENWGLKGQPIQEVITQRGIEVNAIVGDSDVRRGGFP